MSQEKIQQLSLIEENLRNYNIQKQQLQSEILEITSALEELDKTDVSYKIIGNVMVKVGKEALKKELESKKEMSEVRMKAFEKQESKLKEKAESLQQEILKSMEKNK